MPQLSVYRLATGELVVDCQADELSILPTRFVAPLLDPELVPSPIKALHPIFTVDDRELILATHAAAAISRNQLGEPLHSLAAHRYTIIKALDFLITGV
jgi:toxin CcdB